MGPFHWIGRASAPGKKGAVRKVPCAPWAAAAATVYCCRALQLLGGASSGTLHAKYQVPCSAWGGSPLHHPRPQVQVQVGSGLRRLPLSAFLVIWAGPRT